MSGYTRSMATLLSPANLRNKVGSKDPLLPDTRRLAAAWRRRGVTCEERYYPGEMHAFHALVWRKQARACWAEQFGFLNDQWEG